MWQMFNWARQLKIETKQLEEQIKSQLDNALEVYIVAK